MESAWLCEWIRGMDEQRTATLRTPTPGARRVGQGVEDAKK